MIAAEAAASQGRRQVERNAAAMVASADEHRL
jgi:hypothetical protein